MHRFARLLIASAVSLVALAATVTSAYATIITTGTGTPFNGNVTGTTGSVVLTGILDITCGNSVIVVSINGTASTGVVTSLSFTNCNQGCLYTDPTSGATNLVAANPADVRFDKGPEPTRMVFQEQIPIHITCGGLLGQCTVTLTPGQFATFIDATTQLDFDVTLTVVGAAGPCGFSPGHTGTYNLNQTIGHVG